KDRRSDSYRCRSSFFNTRCCTCPCHVGRNRFESSHWRGRSSSERNHHDDDGQNGREVANHGFSEHRERGLDEVKEQNLVIRSQSKSKRTITNAISKSGKAFSFLIGARAICLHLE